MSKLNELLIFGSENAYESVYDLSIKRNFSTPKIYSANGDLKKRWYIYFSYRDPETGKLKRVTPFWNYYIRLDIKLRDLELHKLTLNHEKKKQKLQYII
jgi:hypothetical protein